MLSNVFAFGPGETWFYETAKTWEWGDLPPGIHRRFPKNGETAAGSKISHVHNMVFGVNGSYMITWKGKDGSNYQANHGLPANLTAWLDKKNNKGFLIRDVVNIQLALGPNNESFFVTDGKDFLWQGLPIGLKNYIEKLRKKGGGFTSDPRIVCLGHNGSYILVTDGNGGSWNVEKEYPELDKFLDQLKAQNGNQGGMFAGVSYISLDVFDGQHYVVVRNGGHNAFVPNIEAFKKVASTIAAPTVARAAPARAPAHRHQSSGIGSILKLANMALNSGNGGGGGGGYGGDSGGGDSGGYTQPSMDFTSNLQNQTWNSVDSAASGWNAQ